MGIEPTLAAWEAAVLPLNYTRDRFDSIGISNAPASRAAYTEAQVYDLFALPDWHPDDHPPMPEVVARGRRPSVYACGYCHLPNGKGRPENAALAGLPAAYMYEQVTDFRSGEREHGGGADAARRRAAGALNPPEGGLNLV